MFDILHCLFYKQYICQFSFFLSKDPPAHLHERGPWAFFSGMENREETAVVLAIDKKIC
jgi:hypothetical protein